VSKKSQYLFVPPTQPFGGYCPCQLLVTEMSSMSPSASPTKKVKKKGKKKADKKRKSNAK